MFCLVYPCLVGASLAGLVFCGVSCSRTAPLDRHVGQTHWMVLLSVDLDPAGFFLLLGFLIFKLQ